MNMLRKVLNLNKLEEKVLYSIEKEAKVVASIAVDAKIPRTSVDDIVRRLAHRGLLKKIKNGKRSYYKKRSELEIIQTIFPSKKLPEGIYSLPLIENLGITIYSGRKQVLSAFEYLYSNYTSGRIYGIQPNISVKYIFKNIPFEKIQNINKIISEKNIIQESIIEEGYFEEAKIITNSNYYKWEKVLRNRISIVHEIKNDQINFNSELVLYNKTAMLTDWKNLVAIEILHPEIVKMLKSLFSSYQKIGKRILLK